MLNFRKIRQDFKANLLKEGKDIFDDKKVCNARLISLGTDTIRMAGTVQGNFGQAYECEFEVDRHESEIIDSSCDCPYHSDCQHLAALVFHSERHIDEMIVAFSETFTDSTDIAEDAEESAALLEVVEQARETECARKEEAAQRELLREYAFAACVLSTAPFFGNHAIAREESAELMVTIHSIEERSAELALAIRVPNRSKPIHILQPRQFLDAIRHEESMYLAGKRYLLTLDSFDQDSARLLRQLLAYGQALEQANEKQRLLYMDHESLGEMLAQQWEHLPAHEMIKSSHDEQLGPTLPGLFMQSLDQPLRAGCSPVQFRFEVESLAAGHPRLFLQPNLLINNRGIALGEVTLLECVRPGCLFEHHYYRFHRNIQRAHLRSLSVLEDLAIPEPLFGTFVEQSLPALRKCAQVLPCTAIRQCLTIPATEPVSAICRLTYLDGRLEAHMHFIYEGVEIPSEPALIGHDALKLFCSSRGVYTRQLAEERAILDELFQDFHYRPEDGTYTAKSDRCIIEFMTETLPRWRHQIQFECPQNLLDQFIYDDTSFEMHARLGEKVDRFEIVLEAAGPLNGVPTSLLWDCLASRRPYVELPANKYRPEGRILVLDLDKLSTTIQLLDELGIEQVGPQISEKPLWTLICLQPEQLAALPFPCSISPELESIQQQMLGNNYESDTPQLKLLKAELRPYQELGVSWLLRLQRMHLNGILADDMGLGKTVQAIAAFVHYRESHPNAMALIVCPTSLLYNWKEELHRYAPHLKVLVVDGVPTVRKKLLGKIGSFDIIITSYTLLQKDIETHMKRVYAYAILDEAQHIKNRGTRNAKSVKMIRATHKLILSGTPVENSLEELWSLFDFLMPGLLGSFERFQERYMRHAPGQAQRAIEALRCKVGPFILRRMKSDVLRDLPPISEMIYHCQLSQVQQDLYRSYATSAREELTKLVSKEGFEKVQIHVLATLTRLKQICCHPGIFAKESRAEGDSAKYDLLLEVLESLIESGRKTVIFSQYTRMLQIMREDFEQRGIRFCYLDGSSKNRLDIVHQFNADPNIPVFLVSLKAGGTGLNLVGADTVIHYDIWWNPAVENQATDRVYRLGQDKPVTALKLVTLQTIEEKILQMQQRKRGLVKKVVSCDDEALTKLTWEEVLELLQT